MQAGDRIEIVEGSPYVITMMGSTGVIEHEVQNGDLFVTFDKLTGSLSDSTQFVIDPKYVKIIQNKSFLNIK